MRRHVALHQSHVLSLTQFTFFMHDVKTACKMMHEKLLKIISLGGS